MCLLWREHDSLWRLDSFVDLTKGLYEAFYEVLVLIPAVKDKGIIKKKIRYHQLSTKLKNLLLDSGGCQEVGQFLGQKS
jgi:hydroxypyruvate isomerase